jgi:uncharacterized damage-inducible protein DinB
MSTDIETTANQFKCNNGLFDRIVQGIPAEQWLTQPSDDCNHLLWVTGHMTVVRAVALNILGAPWSAPWQNIFKRGEKRVENSQYPPIEEIQNAWKEVAARLLATLPQASPELLNKPVEKGRPSIDGTVGGTLGFLCLHESYHLGQMGLIRKWLGYGQALG